MERRCRKHPSHRQSGGVCPSCLRERLLQISAAASTGSSTNTASSLYSSRGSCTSCDGGSSTPGSARRERKLDKSRSMACVLGVDAREKKKGGKGFWYRLLGVDRWRLRNTELKDGKVVLLSKTPKNTSSARWPAV